MAEKKKTTSKRTVKKLRQLPQKTRTQVVGFLSRRPHRSFKLTRRRDYARSLKLPGYFAFTRQVFETLRAQKGLYLALIFIYAFVTAVLVGVASQDTYTALNDALAETSEGVLTGGFGEVQKAGILLATGIGGNFYGEMTETQQVFGALLGVLLWLTTIWLLRAQLAGRSVRLRDGMYNAGAPIVPMIILVLVFALQLIPAAIAVVAYSTALSTDFLSGGVEGMLFAAAAALLVILSVYLITTTFMSLVIITLPGMYPWRALRAAGDMVVGRRLRLLLRLVWMSVVVTIAWALIMIPIILLTNWLQSYAVGLAWIPIVPICVLLLSSASTVYVTAYIYLLYRKVVDDDASPA